MEMPAEMKPQTPLNGIPDEDVNEVLLDLQMTVSENGPGIMGQLSVPIMIECTFDAYDKYVVAIKAIQAVVNKVIDRLGGKASMYADFPEEQSECTSKSGSHEFEIRVYDPDNKDLVIGCKVCNEEYEIKGRAF
jgi:hypothetical protein